MGTLSFLLLASEGLSSRSVTGSDLHSIFVYGHKYCGIVRTCLTYWYALVLLDGWGQLVLGR